MNENSGDSSERIVPGRQVSVRQHLLLLRHQFAYAFARQHLPADARVLEVGCGAGYGSTLLSDPADPDAAGCVAEYVGLDVDQATVEHASRSYPAEQRRFESYDGLQIPFDAGRFDVALSFQVIEHLEDAGRYVAEIRRVLANDGVLFLTTPNRLTRVDPGDRPWNRYHVREYAPAELADLMGGAFGDVAMLGVRGSDEVERIEHARLRSIRRIASIDVFGLRDRIPEWLRQTFVRSLEYRAPRVAGFDDRYAISDFHSSSEDLERSLDLLAVCRGSV